MPRFNYPHLLHATKLELYIICMPTVPSHSSSIPLHSQTSRSRTGIVVPGHRYLQLASQRRTSTTLPVLAIVTRTSSTIKAHSICVSLLLLSFLTATPPQTSNIHIAFRPIVALAIETQHCPTHDTTTGFSAVCVSSTTTMATTIKMQRVCCRLIAAGLWGVCIGRCRGGWVVKWVGYLGDGKGIRGWEARFSGVLLEKVLA
jgi:hypothetical protein